MQNLIFTILLTVSLTHAVSAPGQLYDLSNWVLQLPSGTPSNVDQVSQPALKTYTSKYFFTNPATNEMTFWCPVNGVHTGGSQYPRTELRESYNVPGNNDGHGSWTFKGFHQMNVTMKVLQEPASKTITIGQAHAQSIGSKTISGACSIVIEFEWIAGKLSARLRGAPTSVTANDCGTASVNFPQTYAVGETFSYSLVVQDKTVKIWTSKGGWSPVHSYSWWSNSGANTYWLYFKAGDYVQDTGSSSTVGGKTSISVLKTKHTS